MKIRVNGDTYEGTAEAIVEQMMDRATFFEGDTLNEYGDWLKENLARAGIEIDPYGAVSTRDVVTADQIIRELKRVGLAEALIL